MSILWITLLAFSTFFLGYGWFLLCDKRLSFLPSTLKQPLIGILFLGGISCIITFFITPNQNDAVYPTTITSLLSFLATATGLLFALRHTKSTPLHIMLILLACAINILLLPHDFTFSNGLLPPLAERVILCLAWILFTGFYYNLNGVDGVVSIQSLAVVLGLFLMFLIGIMPELYSGWNLNFACLLLALAFFTNYPSIISLDKVSCQTLGFIVGWLSLLATVEGNGSCVLILNMYYIYEVVVALFKKLNFQRQFKILMNNMFYNQLAAAGIAPQKICEFVSQTNLILILLAGFQIYAPNQYTMVIVAFFTMFWITSRITSPQNNTQHLLLTGSLLSLLKKNKSTTEEDNKK